MSLADEIRLLRDRALADLRGVHDYYADTKIAWDIVHEYIADGKTLAVKNVVTGTVTTETDLAGKAQSYMTQHLRATFQQFISIFEDFLFGFLRLWLREHPQSLSAKKVAFGAILKAADKDAITLHARCFALADCLAAARSHAARASRRILRRRLADGFGDAANAFRHAEIECWAQTRMDGTVQAADGDAKALTLFPWKRLQRPQDTIFINSFDGNRHA